MRLAVRDKSTDRMGTMEIPFPLAPEPSDASQAAAPNSVPPVAQKP
jgi:hypothetical protein